MKRLICIILTLALLCLCSGCENVSQETVFAMDTVMEHFEHIKNLVGIDHVTFGPDTLYGNHVGLHHAFDALFSTKYDSDPGVPYEEVPFVKYLENPTETSWNLVRELVRTYDNTEFTARLKGVCLGDTWVGHGDVLQVVETLHIRLDDLAACTWTST